MNSIIEKLNQIEFHDIPVEALHFKMFPTILMIDFALYDEDLEDYNYYQLSLIDIQKLEMNQKISFGATTSLDIYTFDYVYKDNFEGKLGFSLEFGPYFEVTFRCKNIQLQSIIL